MQWIDEAHEAFDFETSGTKPEYALQAWRIPQGKAWATSLATVRRDSNQTIVGGGLAPTRDMMADWLEQAIAAKRRIVGWHTPFDIAILLAYGLEELVMRAKWLDGRLLWRHLEVEPEYELTGVKRKSFGLKTYVEEFLPQHAGYQDEVDFHDETPEARDVLHKYNIRDTVFTLKGAEHCWGLLTPRQRTVALIEAESLPLVAQANLQGIPVDTLVTRALRQHLIDTAQEKLDRLAPLGMTEKIIRSPVQLAKLMFDSWGLPVLKVNTSKLTGNTTRSTDKEVLHELALGVLGLPPDPRVKCLREYREALNNCTKFADAPLKSVDYNEDERTHPQAMVFGTYSGRLTYSSGQKAKGPGKREGTEKEIILPIGFALHQEKRDKRFREPHGAPPGYDILEFDAAGQEFRWMAVASRDTTMLELCLPGEDAHSFMGARINNWDYRETIKRYKANELEVSGPQGGRMLGKVGNLSLQYRTSAKRLRITARVDYKIPMEMPQAEHIHKTYRMAYPLVPAYWKYQIDLTKRDGYVETMAGRRVKVVGDWTGNLGWSMASTAINYRIQGTGADQKYLALAVIKPYLNQIGAYFAWDLHDGIYLFVPTDKVHAAAAHIKPLLDNLPYQRAWGITPPIPMPWDCHYGASWGTLKDWTP